MKEDTEKTDMELLTERLQSRTKEELIQLVIDKERTIQIIASKIINGRFTFTPSMLQRIGYHLENLFKKD